VVAVAVRRRRQAHGSGAHAPAGEGKSRPLGAAAPDAASPAGGGGGVGHIVLGRERPRGQASQAGGDDQRPVGARQGLPERLDRAAVGVGRDVAGEHLFVLEGEVNDSVGRCGRGAQGVEVVERAAVGLGASGLHRAGRGVGAGEPDDLVAGG